MIIKCLKVDAIKFWLMWKARGTSGLQLLVDQVVFYSFWYRLVKPMASTQCWNIAIVQLFAFGKQFYTIAKFVILSWQILLGIYHLACVIRKKAPAWWKRLCHSGNKETFDFGRSLMITYATAEPEQFLSHSREISSPINRIPWIIFLIK